MIEPKTPSQAEQENDIPECRDGILPGECNTAFGSPDSAKTWGQLRAWITQNQAVTPIGSTDKSKSNGDPQKISETFDHKVNQQKSPSRSPTATSFEPDPTLVFDIPVEQGLATEMSSVQKNPHNGYARCGLTKPSLCTNKVPPVHILGGSYISGPTSAGLTPDTSLKYEEDSKKLSTIPPGTNRPLRSQSGNSVEKTASPTTGPLPQSLSHLSVDIVEGLLDVAKPTSEPGKDPLLLYKPMDSGVGQASKHSFLRQHRRALQFGTQSIFYVMSTPEALLRSFRPRSEDAWEPSSEDKLIESGDPHEIDQAIRCLKVFDQSKIIFRSLWIVLGALFTPPPDLSHPKSQRLKAAISLSKTRSSSSSGEQSVVSSSTSSVYYADREAVHIFKVCLSALVAAVPQASAQTMLAVRTLRASGKVAPDPILLTTNVESVRLLLEVTDALEDELAHSLMCRLVQAIAARCCAAEIRKNKQTRNYSATSQDSGPIDVLRSLREHLREAHSDTSDSGAVKSMTAGWSKSHTTAGENNGWSIPAVTVELLRSVLLKEWDSRAEVARWGVVGGAVIILDSLCNLTGTIFHS